MICAKNKNVIRRTQHWSINDSPDSTAAFRTIWEDAVVLRLSCNYNVNRRTAGQCCRLSDDVVCRMLSLDRNLTPTHSNCARRTRLCSHPSCKTRCHFVSWCFPEIMVNFSHLHIHIRWERFRPGFPGCSSRDSSVRVRLSKDAQ